MFKLKQTQFSVDTMFKSSFSLVLDVTLTVTACQDNFRFGTNY